MLGRIFPKQIDNNYRGHPSAFWLLAPFLLAKTFACVNQIGLNPFLSGRAALLGIEKVPLDTYGANAGDAALVLFAWWGAASLMTTFLGWLALIRYRSMIPLIWLLSAIEKIAEQAIAEASPVVGMLGAGAPQPYIAIALLLVGFCLSVAMRGPNSRLERQAD